MPDDLYDRDFVIWSEQQADLLRRLAAAGLFEQAIIHLLKLRAFPHSFAQRKWRGEVSVYLGQAQDRFTPSMRQRLDIPHQYARALSALQAENARRASVLPGVCLFTLDDLLADPPDSPALLAKLE